MKRIMVLRAIFFGVLIGMLLGVFTPAQAQVGKPWAWGENGSGQLGDDTLIGKNTPTQVSGLTKILEVVGGLAHSLAVKLDGTVWAWGYNAYGQLGDGTTTDKATPVQVTGLTKVVHIAVGYYHSLALKSDGTVWAWGNNEGGQLGNGTLPDSPIPVQVSGLNSITQIAAGGRFHSLALKSDGTIWVWGVNFGNGSTKVPVKVSELMGVVQVASGRDHALVLKSDGTVWAWGNDNSGQLGDGGHFNWKYPVQVKGLGGVVQVAGGNAHSLALKLDGTVWAWGGNTQGQLGDGTIIERDAPIQVSGLSGVVYVSGGLAHSLAVKLDGTVWAWGYNEWGELGDGTNTKHSTPVQTLGLTGQVYIGAGFAHSLSVQPVLLNTKTSSSNLTFTYGKPITIVGYLKDISRGIIVVNRPITFSLDGNVVGTAYTNAAGKASLLVPNSLAFDVGTHTINVAFAGSGLYTPSNGINSLTITIANTSISTGTFSGGPGNTKNLTTTLKRKTDNAYLVNQSLTYKIDENVIGIASTDGTGKASLSYKFDETLSIGAHTLAVEYAGDKNHNASKGSGTLNFTQSATQLSVTSVSGKVGVIVTLKAKLTRKTDGASLNSKTVRFQIDWADVGSAVTSAGIATLSYTIPGSLSRGTHTINVDFDGDSLYEGVSNSTKTLTVK